MAERFVRCNLANRISGTIISKILEQRLEESLMDEARSIVEPKLREVVKDVLKEIEINAETYIDMQGFGDQVLRIIVQNRRS